MKIQMLIQQVLEGKIALSGVLLQLRENTTQLTSKDLTSLLTALGVKKAALPIDQIKKIQIKKGTIEIENALGEIARDHGSVSCQPLITAEVKADGLGIHNIQGVEINEGMIQADLLEIRFDKNRRVYGTGGKFMLKLEKELPVRIPDHIQP